jgi:hypothetical protein
MSCLPSTTVMVSNFTPGLRARRTAEISVLRPMSRLTAASAAPRYLYISHPPVEPVSSIPLTAGRALFAKAKHRGRNIAGALSSLLARPRMPDRRAPASQS